MVNQITSSSPSDRLRAKRRRRRASVIILLTAALALVALIWGNFAHLDQISRATGKIIPAGRVQAIQAPDGGQIVQILVKEGDHVRRGQTLFTLDQVKIGSAVSEGKSQVAALEAQMARIEAELFDKPLAFPDSVNGFPEVANRQRQLYNKRRNALQGQISAMKRMRALAQRELDMNQPLLALGDVSRSEVMRLQRQLVDIEAQSENTQNRYLQDLQAEYAKVGEDLMTAQEVLKQRQAAMQDTVITASTDGVVKNVRFNTIGGVLRAGDELAQIVPTSEELIIEAQVSTSDIAYIKQGQGATLKFDAYDPSIFGSASGLVTYVSPDTFADQQPGVPERTFYRVYVRVDTRPMKRVSGQFVALQPGMTATVEIKTGDNTVLGYLMKPIIKTVSEAMHER